MHRRRAVQERVHHRGRGGGDVRGHERPGLALQAHRGPLPVRGHVDHLRRRRPHRAARHRRQPDGRSRQPRQVGRGARPLEERVVRRRLLRGRRRAERQEQPRAPEAAHSQVAGITISVVASVAFFPLPVVTVMRATVSPQAAGAKHTGTWLLSFAAVYGPA